MSTSASLGLTDNYRTGMLILRYKSVKFGASERLACRADGVGFGAGVGEDRHILHVPREVHHILRSAFGRSAFGVLLHVSWFPIHGSRFMVHGSWFMVHGSWFMVHGSRLRIMVTGDYGVYVQVAGRV